MSSFSYVPTSLSSHFHRKGRILAPSGDPSVPNFSLITDCDINNRSCRKKSKSQVRLQK